MKLFLISALLLIISCTQHVNLTKVPTKEPSIAFQKFERDEDTYNQQLENTDKSAERSLSDISDKNLKSITQLLNTFIKNYEGCISANKNLIKGLQNIIAVYQNNMQNIPSGLLGEIIANIQNSIVTEQKVVTKLQNLNQETQGVLANAQATNGLITMTAGNQLKIVQIFDEIQAFNEDQVNYCNQEKFFMKFWISDLMTNAATNEENIVSYLTKGLTISIAQYTLIAEKAGDLATFFQQPGSINLEAFLTRMSKLIEQYHMSYNTIVTALGDQCSALNYALAVPSSEQHPVLLTL